MKEMNDFDEKINKIEQIKIIYVFSSQKLKHFFISQIIIAFFYYFKLFYKHNYFLADKFQINLL